MPNNERLDQFVAEREGITRSASQKLIESGLVTVNGEVRPKNYKLRPDDVVEVELPEPEPMDALPQDIPLDIVYEDDQLIVINKPKGMVVHPAVGNPDGTLVNALLYHCGESLSGINGVIRPGIVHRLDKDTSGLLVVAKADDAHVFLAEQLKSCKMGRMYEAIVLGRLKDAEGTVNAPIARHPNDRKKMAIVAGGRESVTHYRVLREFSVPGDGIYTHVALQLETGRTHQIRVHMASLGHPVMGDPLYGSGNRKFERQQAELLAGQCLHARTLEFVHPKTGQTMRFDRGLPAYFTKLLELLGKQDER